MSKPVVLIIRDGWGYSEKEIGNGPLKANTSRSDRYRAEYPRSILEASGEAVGLLPGYFGNSEVNHLNMGAGRVVRQDLKRIHDAIDDGSFFDKNRLKLAIERCKKGDHALHIFGILQDTAVHAHVRHLKSILQYANKKNIPHIYIHILADGRDSAPRSVKTLLKDVDEEKGNAEYATLCGRYFLDRGGDYALTKVVYDLITKAEGERCIDINTAIEEGYKLSAPDRSSMTDEYLPPSVLGEYSGVKEDDSVIFFNFRQDRAVQIAKAFTQQMWDGPEVFFAGMTKYYDDFDDYIFEPLSLDKELKGILGETISEYGKRQFRIADSQKFRHVTSFFNGKRIAPFPGEDRCEIALPNPDQYIRNPGMGAYGIADIAEQVITHGIYDFIAINFANCDTVGHTANEQAVLEAIEAVDECTGKVVDSVLKEDGLVLVTADHGNADEYLTEDGEPKSAHTANPVECFLLSNDPEKYMLRPKGIIPDIAPTILDLMQIEKPAAMTAESLVVD